MTLQTGVPTMDSNTKYAELADNNIGNQTQLFYFIERFHITPVKATRLNSLLGEMLLEQSDGVVCFKCDGELDSENIIMQSGKYNHAQCPKSAYIKVQSYNQVKIGKYFRQLGG